MTRNAHTAMLAASALVASGVAAAQPAPPPSPATTAAPAQPVSPPPDEQVPVAPTPPPPVVYAAPPPAVQPLASPPATVTGDGVVSATAEGEERGFYGSVALGAGATFGSSPFDQGLGLNLVLGYAPSASFGIGAMAHYNDADIEDLAKGGGVIFGPEVRGFVGQDLIRGWASFAVVFGSGSIEDDGGYSDGGKLEATLAPSPVLGFGVEARIAPNFRVGVQGRWAILQLSEVCANDSEEEELCDDDIEEEPDGVFFGLTLTYAMRAPSS